MATIDTAIALALKQFKVDRLKAGEDCVVELPTGYGKPELSIMNFPVRGSSDLIRQLKGHEKMTCKPYLSDPDDMKLSLGYDFNQTAVTYIC